MITLILCLIYFVSVFFTLGKGDLGFKAAPIANTLSIAPIVGLFFNPYFFANVIILSAIGAFVLTSTHRKLSTKINCIIYIPLVALFFLNNWGVFIQ